MHILSLAKMQVLPFDLFDTFRKLTYYAVLKQYIRIQTTTRVLMF